MATNPYDREHQAVRNDWDQLIQTGHRPTCPRCHHTIEPGQPWQLGHTNDLALGGHPKHRRPEHKHCNESAGGTIAHHTPPSRPW